MTTAIIVGTVLLFVGLAFIALCWMVAKEAEWARCPQCKNFHRGIVSVPFMPPDCDGTFRVETCDACDKSKFWAERDREIENHFLVKK